MLLSPKISLLLNVCVFVSSVIAAQRSKNAEELYCAYVLSGALMVLIAAGFYTAARLSGDAGSFFCRTDTNRVVAAVMQSRYPTPQALADFKANESIISGVWGPALILAVGMMAIPCMCAFFGELLPLGYAKGTPFAQYVTFDKWLLVRATVIYLVYAVVQGQFLIDPRYGFIDQLYINHTHILLVASCFGGILGVITGVFILAGFKTTPLSVPACMFALTMFFNMSMSRSHSTHESIMGQRYRIELHTGNEPPQGIEIPGRHDLVK
jgi:uncharacterized membrane protein YphA (DoxX/SURF4 family)